MKKDYIAQDRWLDYIVDTNKDYYLNEMPLKNLPVEEMSIVLGHMLKNYDEKLYHLSNDNPTIPKKLEMLSKLLPKLFSPVYYQFVDFYYRCLDLLSKKSAEVDSKFFDIQEVLEENLIECSGTLKGCKNKMLDDIDNKYEEDEVKPFHVGQYLTKPQIAQFQDRVMAQLVCLFPNMKKAMSKEYITHFDNYNDIQNTIENARLVQKLNEYATCYDEALRYEDMHTMLNNYASYYGVIKEDVDDVVYDYDENMVNRAYAMQLYIEEEKSTDNLLTILMHLVVDYDFLSAANKLNTVLNLEKGSVIGKYELTRIIETTKRFGDIQEYLLPLMQAPYYSSFNIKNFKDETVFWYLDRVVKMMIEYLYSPVNQKVVRFHKLEQAILTFKNERYPKFMEKVYPRKKDELKVKKVNKTLKHVQEEFLNIREKVQTALKEANLSIDDMLQQKDNEVESN